VSVPLHLSQTPGPLRTRRLRLREFRPADIDDLFRLDSDPRVMRCIGDGRVGTHQSVRDALERATRYYRNFPGLGVWPAEELAGGRFIGWFCLKYIPNTVDVEVGYRLLPQAWGRGFATEGASAMVEYAFDQLGLYRIVGVTHPDNAASQRVLQKSGLRDAGWGRYYGRDLRLFVAESRLSR
jgi:[ribosomal protein S5]-alanine N-acetyltransferase